jgi:Fic family protein
MIYQEPALQSDDLRVLELIRAQRDRLRLYTQNNPRRWSGSLRRSTFARAIQGSNSIEGYNASIDEAIAAIEDEPPLDERTETWFAINGYRDALTYIMQAAQDHYFEFSKQFLKSLHFMMLNYDMSKFPGQWRPGPIYVVAKKTGETVYEGPSAEVVDSLICELVDYLDAGPNSSAMVRAAMAHLNLTMIHPFKDGNGRMARALQTLVLAREGILHPVFSSIEEWLGRNTEEYYAVLASTGRGEWNPRKDALPWVRFCLKAHYQQAATLIRRHEEYGALYEQIDAIVLREKLNDRMGLPLFDAALGMRLTNARYQTDADVTQYVASRDLRKLSDNGLIEPKGEKRGRFYVAGKELKALRQKVRVKRPLANPYDLLSEPDESVEPRLPGV